MSHIGTVVFFLQKKHLKKEECKKFACHDLWNLESVGAATQRRDYTGSHTERRAEQIMMGQTH